MLLDAADLFDIRLPAYLIDLSSAPGNHLMLMIEEATGLGPPGKPEVELTDDPDTIVGDMLADSRAIEPRAGDRVIEVVWKNIVAYAVTDESFAGPERDGEAANGRVARRVKESWFDDFVRSSTFATDNYPGPMQHYSIVTLNHVVNVISASEPQIRLVRVHETQAT